MDILRPRGTYQRASSSDPTLDASPLAFENNFEMASSSVSQLDDKTPSFKSGFSANIRDEAPLLLDPSTDPIQRPESSYFGRRWKWPALGGHSRLYGWRTGALFAAFFSGTSFLINFVVLVWLATHKGNSGQGLVELFSGGCSKIERMDLWVHLAINALSTVLLGGSNYCMQCLCAPTRKDVDAAHAKGSWVDIGVPSTRNLSRVPVYKSVMWGLMGFSSVPLHLMYNSAFYKSLSTNDYSYYVVSDNFLTNTTFTPSANVDMTMDAVGAAIDPAKIQSALKVPGLYERLDKRDCIHAYGTNFITDRRNLVMVADNSTAHDANLFAISFYDYTADHPYNWICVSDPDIEAKAGIPIEQNDGRDEQTPKPCQKYLSQVEAIADIWDPYGYNVQYCLSERVPEKCSYNGNIPIVAIVLVANLIKLVGMLYVAFRLRDAPLITVGDAVESFLNEPDRTTRGMCLLTKEDVVKSIRKRHRWDQPRGGGTAAATALAGKEPDTKPLPSLPPPAPKVARIRKLRWSKSASGLRWSLTMGLILLALITVAALFWFATRSIVGAGFTILDIGFGKVTPSAIITGWKIGTMGSAANRILSSILVANAPQTIFSFLYLNLNGLLTTLWVASEWSDFATERKTLRVSKPKGAQRSTHFLQLPYKVAMPLMVLSGLLHWMISQAIFLVVLAEYNTDGTLASPVAVASCGFSPLAMVLALVAGIIIVTAVLALAFFRHYDPRMPLAGSCSAAISAACHQPEWDTDAATKPVKWGVVPDSLVGNDDDNEDDQRKESVGHCSFTSGNAAPLQDGRRYAGLSTTTRRKECWPCTTGLKKRKAFDNPTMYDMNRWTGR